MFPDSFSFIISSYFFCYTYLPVAKEKKKEEREICDRALQVKSRLVKGFTSLSNKYRRRALKSRGS